jgi:elongation factor P
MQVEMRNLETGNKTNKRFNSTERVERVTLSQREMQFLYEDGGQYHFMDMETYDQIELPKEFLGERAAFLQDGMTVTVESHEGKPLGVKLPLHVTLEVVEAEPVVKGQTAASSYKPAVLENGLRVMVPPFVSAGEKIVVNTEELTYVKRAES